MAKKSILRDVAAQAQNRRSFVRKLALAGAAGTAVLGTGGKAKASDCGLDDVDILQFALNLEFLEAEFYTVASTGHTIDQFGISISGDGTPGPTTGGQMIYDFQRGSAMGILLDIANQLALDERNHVKVLQEALTYYFEVTPIAKPAINLNALGYGLRNSTEFVQVGRILEDIGISAYNWALYYLEDDLAYQTGLQILAAEGQHAGNLRAQCGALSAPSQAIDCYDVPTPPYGTYFSSGDGPGISASRYPEEVLYLAYGNKPYAFGGGFFPNGVNGYFSQSGLSSCED